MRINAVTPVWSAAPGAAPVGPNDRSGIVDRVERVSGKGFVRTISVDIQGLRRIDGEGVRGPTTRLELIGARGRDGVLHRVGYPELPAVRFFVAAESAKDIRVQLGPDRDLQGTQRLPICQPSVPKSGEAPSEVEPVDFEGFYPPARFSIEEAGTRFGQKQYLVSVYPVAVTRDGRMNVIPKFDISAKAPSKVDERPKNGEQKTFAFIVGAQFEHSPSLARYRAIKERAGFAVETILIGRDANTPDEIRAKLKGMFHDRDKDLQYALIVGDFEDVPAPVAKNISGVTDHYYRAIDTDGYDADINGPDIGVGRLPVANEEQLDGVVRKLVKYAKRDFAKKDWLGKMSFLATNDQWKVAEGSHNYAIGTYTAPRGYVGSFPNQPQPGGDKVYAITHNATGEDAKRAIAEGRALIDYSGHGAKTFWDAPRMTRADVKAMNHSDARPFVISNACITGDFREPESFAEAWIRHPKGAIMYWGSMDSSYWDEDDVLERAMFDGIFADGRRTFSDITEHALREHWRHYGGEGKSKYYWETYHTFGDPSMKLALGKSSVEPVKTDTAQQAARKKG